MSKSKRLPQPPVETVLSDIKPLSGNEKEKQRKLNKKRSTKRLRAWVRDELVVAAIQDEDIAWSVCWLAGFLARDRAALRNLLKTEMKLGSRWGTADLIMAWIDYVHFLEEANGDKAVARRRLIQKEKMRTGKEISDRRMANLLSKAARDIPLENFPKHIHAAINGRLALGNETNREGDWR